MDEYETKCFSLLKNNAFGHLDELCVIFLWLFFRWAR